MPSLPYAEDVNYWQTSRSSADSWIEKAKKEISKINGTILLEAFGSEPFSGRSAFMLTFQINEDRFKLVWPVLPTRSKNDKAARIQAATFLYHDIKAKCLSAAILGPRVSFFSYYLLPDGRSTTGVADEHLTNILPSILSNKPALNAGT